MSRIQVRLADLSNCLQDLSTLSDFLDLATPEGQHILPAGLMFPRINHLCMPSKFFDEQHEILGGGSTVPLQDSLL